MDNQLFQHHLLISPSFLHSHVRYLYTCGSVSGISNLFQVFPCLLFTDTLYCINYYCFTVNLDTGFPHFSKVRFLPLHFYKRPTFVPAFANRKKSKENFCFYNKRQKTKIAVSICFAMSLIEAALTRAVRVGPQAPCPGTTLSIQHQAPQLWIVSVSTCALSRFICASVSKLRPKVIASSLFTISAHERFRRSAMLSDSGRNLYLELPWIPSFQERMS